MLLTQAVNLARESTKRRAAAGSVGAAAGPEKLVSLECMGGGSKANRISSLHHHHHHRHRHHELTTCHPRYGHGAASTAAAAAAAAGAGANTSAAAASITNQSTSLSRSRIATTLPTPTGNQTRRGLKPAHWFTPWGSRSFTGAH